MLKIQPVFIKLVIFAIVISSGALYSSSHGNHDSSSHGNHERAYKCRLGLSKIKVYSDNVVVAHAWWKISAKEMDFMKIKVIPDEQGKGIGSAILQKVLCIASKQECSKIRLDAEPKDQKDMERLVKFYKKFGFSEGKAKYAYDNSKYMKLKAPFKLDVISLEKFNFDDE